MGWWGIMIDDEEIKRTQKGLKEFVKKEETNIIVRVLKDIFDKDKKDTWETLWLKSYSKFLSSSSQMNGKLLPVFFGWVDIFMRTEINQQHHHHSNGRRETLEKPAQGNPQDPRDAL